MAKVKVYASVEDRLQDAERQMQEFAREQAVEKVQRAIDLLEEAAEGFTRENGGHPSEYNGITTAELILREVIGK